MKGDFGVSRVRFKLEIVTDLLLLEPNEELQCECNSARSRVEVVLRHLRKGDQGYRDNSSWEFHAACIATYEFEPEQRIVSALQDISAGRLPPGSIDPSQLRDLVNPDGTMKPDFGMNLEWMPEWFQAFRHSVHGELAQCAIRLIKLARWYCNAHGSHDPLLSERWLQWSWVSQPWQTLPPHIRANPREVRSLKLPSEAKDAIRELWDAELLTEPLAHELFREAWNQQRTNPRSSLIIGIAAAEAGVKHFIAQYEPGAAWLLENVQSPPLVKIIKEYLPVLIESHGLHPRNRPPDFITQTLHVGVNLRNQVAHGAGQGIKAERLEETLNCIHDLLWMLDVYQGREWARGHVRPASRKAWDPEPS